MIELRTMSDRLEFLPELNDATQYSTVYYDGKPVATLQRRRVMERGPVWRLYATDGTILALWHFVPSTYEVLALRTFNVLRNRNIIEA